MAATLVSSESTTGLKIVLHDYASAGVSKTNPNAEPISSLQDVLQVTLKGGASYNVDVAFGVRPQANEERIVFVYNYSVQVLSKRPPEQIAQIIASKIFLSRLAKINSNLDIPVFAIVFIKSLDVYSASIKRDEGRFYLVWLKVIPSLSLRVAINDGSNQTYNTNVASWQTKIYTLGDTTKAQTALHPQFLYYIANSRSGSDFAEIVKSLQLVQNERVLPPLYGQRTGAFIYENGEVGSLVDLKVKPNELIFIEPSSTNANQVKNNATLETMSFNLYS